MAKPAIAAPYRITNQDLGMQISLKRLNFRNKISTDTSDLSTSYIKKYSELANFTNTKLQCWG